MSAPIGAATGAGLRRDLRLFRLYRFLSTSYLFAPVVVVFFGSRGLSVTEITLLNTVYCATVMLFEVPTGVLADRWGRRRAMILGSLLMALGCLIDWQGHSFLAFAVGEGLLALGMTLTSGADSAYLYDLLRDAGRADEYRRLEGAASAAKLAGAAVALAVGGWLAHRDVGLTYLLTALVCIAASVVAALLAEHRQSFKLARSITLARQVVDAAKHAAGHPPLAFAIVFSALVFTLVRMGIYLHQPYLTAAGLSLSHVGLVMAALSLVAAWGAHHIDALRRSIGERVLVFGLPALLALSYLLLGRWVGQLGIAMIAVQALVAGIYSPLSKDLLNREIAESSHRATVLSVESMVRRLAFGLFAPIAGLAVDHRGLDAGLYVCAGLALLGSAALALQLSRRRVRTPGASPAADAEVGTQRVAG